jgi:hypothetical protein
MKKTMIGLSVLAMGLSVSGCAAAVVGAGLAAADYYADDNDVCDGPNDVGLVDSDCNDGD